MSDNNGISEYQAGRMVEAISAIQKDVGEIKGDLNSIKAEFNRELKPIMAFQNRTLGVVIIIPTLISLFGLFAATMVK